MKDPTECHLWKKERLEKDDLSHQNTFERLCTFEDDGHLSRHLLRCKQCGQLYFFEFYEMIDWKNGNDPQYLSYIPVDSEDEAKSLLKLSPIQLSGIAPSIHYDWPSDAKEPRVGWYGKSQSK